MKILSAAMALHVAGEVTTLCRCWIIETREGIKTGFTDHDQDIMIDGVLCEKNAGMEASSIEDTIGLNVDSQEVAGALQSSHITDADIKAGRYDNAKVSIHVANWSDPAQHFVEQVCLVGEISREDGHYRMELRGRVSELDQSNGNHFVKRCQADLGDQRCKVALSPSQFTGTGMITGIETPVVLSVSGIEAYSGGWFRGGHLTWTSGANTGRSVELAEHRLTNANAVLHLWEPQTNAIAEGDQFSVTAGCDKQFATCREKFSNTLNFRGFPHMPGNDFSLNYASNSEAMDGGPIIP